ncbi:MAG: hypothetical protein ISR65_17430 [Bacteriovoracaceae bacterium]|nr:hypothetical protein [Bacteriovoracaceae bacterium]
MKLLLILLLAFSPFVLNARTILLDREKINAGVLLQSESEPAQEQLVVRRTTKTPRKVKLDISFDYRKKICGEWDQRDRWVPGDLHCTPHGGCSGSPGRWESERFCVRWDRVLSGTSKTIVLNFKRAQRLSSGEEEEFLVTIDQKSLDGRKLDLSGSVQSSDREYSIEEYDGLFTKQGLRFKVR